MVGDKHKALSILPITKNMNTYISLVRDTLIDLYCPPSLRPHISEIKAHHGNTVCIARAYLGRQRRLEKNSSLKSFWIRNFPLHLDQVRELRLDVNAILQSMADALAFLYWSAKTDAADVEFVLAPAPRHRGGEQIGKTFASDALGNYAVWVVDFDCCRSITMDRDGVERAARAFVGNDPYFPRPGRELWDEFVGMFLDASKRVLEVQNGVASDLPDLWVEAVENVSGGREKQAQEDGSSS